MKTESIFRDAALAARMRPKELDEPLWADAPHERLCRLLLAAALVAAVAWGALWRVERTVVREGVLVLAGERFPVVPVLSGTVSKVLVPAGERVGMGQVIARLHGPETAWLTAAARSQRALAEAAARAADEPALDAALAAAAAEIARLVSATEVASPAAGVLSPAGPTVGQRVLAGEPFAEVRAGAGGEAHVVLFVDRDVAATVEPGAPVRVRAEGVGWAGARSARVVEAARPAAEVRQWLPRHADASTPPGATHGLRVALDEPWSGARDGMRVEGAVAVSDRRPLLRLAARGAGPANAVPRHPVPEVAAREVRDR